MYAPQAFEKIAAHLKGLGKEQLAQLNVQAMVELMDRGARGERVALPSTPVSGSSGVGTALQTNATLARPVAALSAGMKADALLLSSLIAVSVNAVFCVLLCHVLYINRCRGQVGWVQQQRHHFQPWSIGVTSAPALHRIRVTNQSFTSVLFDTPWGDCANLCISLLLSVVAAVPAGRAEARRRTAWRAR